MEIKTVNELMAQYPELVNQIQTEAVAQAREAVLNEGAEAERARLQAIDEMAGKVSDAVLMKAKYETFDTAEKVALEAIKTGAFNSGAGVLNAMKQETANADDVTGVVNDMTTGKADDKTQAVNYAEEVAKKHFEAMGRGGNK